MEGNAAMDEWTEFQRLIEDLRSDDVERQRHALQVFRDVRYAGAVPALLELLTHRRRDVRVLAVHALRKAGDRSSIPALLDRLTDRSAEVRRAAARALAYVGDESVLSPLSVVMLTDSNSHVRWEAVKALSAFASAKSLPSLLEALSVDSSTPVRLTAAEALGRIGSSEALDGLIAALMHDDDEQVRVASAKSLGKINDPDAIPALVASLNTINSRLWHAAAEALWHLDVPAMPYVLDTLLSRDPAVRRAALKAVLWLSVEHDDMDTLDRDDEYWTDISLWWN